MKFSNAVVYAAWAAASHVASASSIEPLGFLRKRDVLVRDDQSERMLSGEGGSGGFESCEEQSKCIDFTVKKLSSSTCTTNCPVEICLVINLSKQGCEKSGTVSHFCDTANGSGCPRANNVADGASATSYCGTSAYASNGFHSESKCENVPSGIKICQTGGAGDTLEFILKDGSDDSLSDQGSWTQYVSPVGCYSPNTPLNLQCKNAKSANICCNSGCTGNGDKERLWKVTVPNLCSCGSPTKVPTKAPASPTKAPARPTKAPASPTKAPASPTKAPASPTKAPASPTKAPASPTKAPASPTKAPAVPTSAPTTWCSANCPPWSGHPMCGSKNCIESSHCCQTTRNTGADCTKSSPPYTTEQNPCFVGPKCTAAGTCEWSYLPIGNACTPTGIFPPGCTPSGTCQADPSIAGGVMCVTTPNTGVSKIVDFTLVDANAPITSYELENFGTYYEWDYSDWHKCDYNIRVNVQECTQQIDSVLVEWDIGIKRKGLNYGNLKHCEDYTPYSIFLDPSVTDLGNYGDFNGVLVPVGTHKLTVTAYSGTNCTGTKVDSVNSTIKVTSNGIANCPGTIANLEALDLMTGATQSLVPGGQYCFGANYTVAACTAGCMPDGEVKWATFTLYQVLDVYPNLVELYFYNDTSKWQNDFHMFPYENNKNKTGSSQVLPNGHYRIDVVPYGNYQSFSYVPGLPYTVDFYINCASPPAP